MRPKCSLSGKTSAWSGRNAPPEVYQVDAGEIIFFGDLLGAQVLFHRYGVISASFNGGVVGDNEALLSGDHANAGQ